MGNHEPEQAEPEASPSHSFEAPAEYESYGSVEDSLPEVAEANVDSMPDFGSSPVNEAESYPSAFDVQSQEGHENAPYDFGQTLDITSEANLEVKQNITDSPDFSDVTDFANANTSLGPISYTLIIEGIDSARLTSELKEAMTDSRFAWDVEEVLSSKKSDTLVLNSLSPAKASILVSRIKYLPFKISWRQDVLTGN